MIKDHILLLTANILLIIIIFLLSYIAFVQNPLILAERQRSLVLGVSKDRVKKPTPTRKASPTPTLPILSLTPTPSIVKITLTPSPSITPTDKKYYVAYNGNDNNSGLTIDSPLKTIQKAIDAAEAGDTILLSDGIYYQDLITKKDGIFAKPITIRGGPSAVIKGGGLGRVIEVNHDFITLDGFTVDGKHNDENTISSYRDKLIYVIGKGIKEGVNGLKIKNMTIKNAGGECVRLRYFAHDNEIAYNTFLGCGVHDFVYSAGGKNGEGVYIGTAPEQLTDGKNPTSDPDESRNNWIHHNVFDTQGNECVDIKEAATGNIVEFNKCTGEKDPNSGGMDSRGNTNTFRNNEIYANRGAGVRLGGDTSTQGINNNVYDNIIKDNLSGGIKFMREPQGKICGNTMSGNSGGDSVGNYGSKFSPASTCS